MFDFNIASLFHIVRGNVVGSSRSESVFLCMRDLFHKVEYWCASGGIICHCANAADRCRRSESTYVGSEGGELESAEAA